MPFVASWSYWRHEQVRSLRLLWVRIVLLALILFALYSFDFLGLSLTEEARTSPATLLLVSALHTAVLSYPIVRSRWRGWRLAAAVFLAFYGVATLIVAVEAVYLPEALPSQVVLRLVVNGAIVALIFSPVAVLLLRRMKGEKGSQQARTQSGMSWLQWIWRLALIAVSWVFLFVFFGALVYLPLARSLAPADLASHAAPDLPPWVLPFQGVRALLWAAVTLPLLQAIRGRWWEAGLAVALLFSVLMGANLLRTASMPVGLRVAHIVEVCGENFAFGWIVAGLLHPRRSSAVRDGQILGQQVEP
jgi:hypothetical protein